MTCPVFGKLFLLTQSDWVYRIRKGKIAFITRTCQHEIWLSDALARLDDVEVFLPKNRTCHVAKSSATQPYLLLLQTVSRLLDVHFLCQSRGA